MIVLLMAFEISVALALGFLLGRIYQIRHDELERGFTLPPTARIPQPTHLQNLKGALAVPKARRIAANIAKLPELLTRR
jgi:hypothetical protein